jgi:hypothetical protein
MGQKKVFVECGTLSLSKCTLRQAQRMALFVSHN